MSKPGLVSVIIPAYNYGHYLAECIQSVRAQSYADWEAIIVDDGSTDDTEEVASKLVREGGGKISFHRLANQGVAAARNTGIERSNGEFILPLDADDALNPDALEKLVAAIHKKPSYGFAFCGLENYGALPGEADHWYPGPFFPARIPQENPAACTSLWRKELWQKGVKYRKLIFEDWDLWLQIVAQGYEGIYVPHKLFKYRMHTHGRHTLNKHRYFQSLMEEMLNCPSLYSQDMQMWGKLALHNAPRCFDLPTIVFLLSSEAGQHSQLSGNLLALAKEFIQRGHFVVALGSLADSHEIIPGLVLIKNPERNDWNFIDNRLYMLGREVMVFSEFSSIFTRRLRCAKNVHTIFSLHAAYDPLADGTLSWKGTEALVDRRGGGVLLPKTPMNLQTLVTEVGTLHTAQAEFNNLKENRFRERISTLAKKNEEMPTLGPEPLNLSHLTAIIPCRDADAGRLERTLQSLRLCGSSLQILISDYGSGTEFKKAVTELATNYKAELVQTEASCPWSRSAALNIGIGNCTTPWILACDADLLVDPALFATWLHYRSECGDDAVYLSEALKLPPLDFPPELNFAQLRTLATHGRIHENRSIAVQFFSKRLAEKLHGFNLAYFGWGSEAEDLNFRAELHGARLVWMPAGRVLHQWHLKMAPRYWRERNRDLMNVVTKNSILISNDENWTAPNLHIVYDAAAKKTAEGAYEPLRGVEGEILKAHCPAADRVKLLVAWGAHALHNGEDESALEAFEDAVTLDPQNIDALSGLAHVYMAKGHMPRAGHYAYVVAERAPDNKTVQQILGYFESAARR